MRRAYTSINLLHRGIRRTLLGNPRMRTISRVAAIGLLAAALAPLVVLVPAPRAHAATPGTTICTDISPDNEDAGNTNCQGVVPCVSQQNGGRVNGLAVVPDAPNIYFAASEVGGLFKSTTRGDSWKHLDGHIPATTWDVAVMPGGQRVFATSFNEGRSDTTAVLQVSTDGGDTWSSRLPPAPNGCATVRSQQPSAFGIALRPGTSDVLVGTNCGLALSANAGDTWTRFDPTPADPPSPVWDIVALPGGMTYACGDDGLLMSLDGKPGIWTSLGKPNPFSVSYCSLAVSPDDPNVVFVVFGHGVWQHLFSAGSAEFFEYDAAALVRWTQLPYPDTIAAKDHPNGIGNNGIGRKNRVPFVVTNKRSQGYDLWLGDGSLWRVPCAPDKAPNCSVKTADWCGSYTDGFGNPSGACNSTPVPADNSAHGDSGDLVFDPTVTVDACPTLYSSDGGVYSNVYSKTTADPMSCQNPKFTGANHGLHAFLLWDMEGVHRDGVDARDSVDAEEVYVSTQDNGLYYTETGGANSPTWKHPIGADAFDVAADKTQILATTGDGLFVASPGFSNPMPISTSVLRLPDVPDGMASVGSGEFMVVVPPGCCRDTNGVQRTIPRGVWDITDSKNFFAGQALGSWASSKSPCHIVVSAGADGPQPFVLAGKCVWPVGCVWPCGENGNTLILDDELWTYQEISPGVKDWRKIDPPSYAKGFGVIAVDPKNPDRLYASVVGDQPPRLVRSTDGGRSWTPDDALTNLMNGNGRFLPYPGVETDRIWPYQQPLMVAFDPYNPQILVAGSESSGVFISSDGGASWNLLTDPYTSGTSGVPHLPRPLWAHFDHDKPGVVRIYLGTGRGIWRVDLANADLAVSKAATPDPVILGQNLTYTVEVTNAGPDMALNATLEDTVPSGTTFQSLTAPAGWSCTQPAPNATGSVVCTNPSMAPGTATFTVVVRVVALTGTVTNTAHVSSAVVDANLANNTTSTTTQVLVPVAINIQPGGFPNSVNLKGRVTVAILTTSAGQYGLPIRTGVRDPGRSGRDRGPSDGPSRGRVRT
jgi:uncharacterized repeat protein (TIGR01451 family)